MTLPPRHSGESRNPESHKAIASHLSTTLTKRWIPACAGMTQILVFCLITATTAHALPHPAERLPDPALETRALKLTENLRCVVCQNETIAHSNADMARDMRLLVRREIMAGKTDAQITEFLTARYGDYILMTPPFSPRTYALWLMPAFGLLAGIWLLSPHFTRKRRRK